MNTSSTHLETVIATPQFIVNTNHYQFHLKDAASTPNYSRLWNDHNLPYMLAVAPGIMAVGTARYGGPTRVDIQIVETAPSIDLREWDQAMQCSILFPSGHLHLEVPESGISSPEIIVAPGTYQALVLYGNLDSITDNTLLSGEDHYKIILRPAEKTRLAVLKKWRRSIPT